MPLPPHALLLSDPSSSSASPLPPPPQHPAEVHLFSDTESYLFRCLLGRILTLPPRPPPSLSVLLSTSFCQALNLPSPPPSPSPLFHPPSPNTTCSHRCVAPIYGFVTAATRQKEKARPEKHDEAVRRRTMWGELEHIVKETGRGFQKAEAEI